MPVSPAGEGGRAFWSLPPCHFPCCTRPSSVRPAGTDRGKGVARPVPVTELQHVSCPCGPGKLGLLFITTSPSKLGETEWRNDLPRVTWPAAPGSSDLTSRLDSHCLQTSVPRSFWAPNSSLMQHGFGGQGLCFSCACRLLRVTVQFIIYCSFGGPVSWA